MAFLDVEKKKKKKRIAIEEEIDESRMRTEGQAYLSFSKSGLGAIQL